MESLFNGMEIVCANDLETGALIKIEQTLIGENGKSGFTPSPFSGKFTSGFWFGNACFPNTISKTLTVSP